MKRPKIINNKFCSLKYQITIFAVFIFIVIFYFFNGCKDNPVATKKSTPYQFDSARFNWHVDTLNGLNANVAYAVDSNYLIIAANYYNFKIYDGNTYRDFNLPNNFIPLAIAGLDRSNIFFGGSSNINQHDKPRLYKWDGGGFNEINLPNDTSTQNESIYSIYIRNLSDIWIGTNTGKIMNYDGINFTFHNIDSQYSTKQTYIIFDQNGNLYSVSYQPWSDTLSADTTGIFRYNGNGWQRVFISINGGETVSTYCLMNDYLYSVQILNNDCGLYGFNGNSFTKLLNIDQFITKPGNQFNGTGINDFLYRGIYSVPDTTSCNLFYWNGVKWSVEAKTNPYAFLFYNCGFGNKYFCVFENYYTTYVFIGRRKENKIN